VFGEPLSDRGEGGQESRSNQTRQFDRKQSAFSLLVKLIFEVVLLICSLL